LISGGTGWRQANGRNVFGEIDGRVNRQDGNVILLKRGKKMKLKIAQHKDSVLLEKCLF
jgi:hypothetical protein